MPSVVNTIVPFKAATQRHMNTANCSHATPVERKAAEKAFLRNMALLDKHYEKKTAKMIRKRTIGK
jgi:hypothetical protein